MSQLSPCVADQVSVGTIKILDSGHVSEGPGRIASAPVPSVFMDDRGSIHRLRIGHERVNLLASCKDSMRSGYLHNVLTHDFVISGKVQVWTLAEQGTEKKEYGPLQYFTIDPYVPHILFYLEDTNMVEWYQKSSADDSTGSQFKLWYYHPYRNIVNIQNSAALATKNSPRHHRLVLKDEETNNTSMTRHAATATSSSSSSAGSSGGGNGGRGVSRTSFVLWTMTAMAAGWFLGVMAATADAGTSSTPTSSKRS